jgi:malate dehydrogenase
VSTIAILGAGELGGAIARQIAAAAIASRVVLIDDASTVAAGKALDIRQAAPIDGDGTSLNGTDDLSAVVGATAIILADRYGSTSDEWQGDAGLMLTRRVVELNARAPIVCAGAAQASVVERSVTEFDVPRTRIFGSAPEALRSAIVSLTALDAGCAPQDISLTAIGRPPHDIVVPWNAAAVAGHAATDVLEPPAILRLDARVARLWPPGPLTLASAAARMISAALTRSPRTLSALSVGGGDGQHARRAAMWPVRVGPAGITRVMAPTLTPRDRVRLDTMLNA